MFYVPDFISSYEEEQILSKVRASQAQCERLGLTFFQLPPNRWTVLSHRRLQAHPSTLTANNILLAAPLPPYLTTSPAPIAARFEKLGIFKDTPHGAPNHCLVNEYRRGEGIMPHEDGAAYAPVVATVSLGGTVVLDVTPKPAWEAISGGTAAEEPEQDASLETGWRIVCEPRSLLITTQSAYTTTLHGIPPVEVDEDLGPDTVANWPLLGNVQQYLNTGGKNERTTRVSLTYRDVLKVSKAGGLGKILGGGRR
ncbi:Oxoglutarate/iron-dependent oxygenase [Macrophomina phaseolina MS6]|uniref:Oxoglutarate/iron-dependent oxygenase n=1 Tax=Macrophomina phaseolina (strain MS6) TaxID=1126212 RepID=K2S3Z1_MACPH|nr:Oxoglutarate/iron-dependent oxygenase [Macrophomina phaseolina MS6]